MTAPNYSIVELAELGGVSRRTVRYYVQESLLPSLGVGQNGIMALSIWTGSSGQSHAGTRPNA